MRRVTREHFRRFVKKWQPPLRPALDDWLDPHSVELHDASGTVRARCYLASAEGGTAPEWFEIEAPSREPASTPMIGHGTTRPGMEELAPGRVAPSLTGFAKEPSGSASRH